MLKRIIAMLVAAMLWGGANIGPALAVEQTVRGTPARFMGALKIKGLNAAQLTAQGNPPAGWVFVYIKTADGLLYAKDSAGTEYQLSSDGAEFGTSGTDIVLATADNDVLLDNGSTLGWGTADQGTLDTIWARVSGGVLSLSGAATASGGIQFLEDTDNGVNYTFVTPGQSLSGNSTITLPTGTRTLATLDGTEEFTGKTVTAAVIKTGLTASGSASNDFSASTGTFKTSTGLNTIGGQLDLVAGTTALAPLRLVSGTNLTTAAAGAVEYDGKVIYGTTVASSRQLLMTPQLLCINSPYTLTDATTQQALFGSSGAALTVAAGTTYQFEGYFAISSMSATSGNCKFSPAGIGAAGGTATILSCTWECTGLDATTPGTAAAVGGSTTATTTADPISTGDMIVAATGTAMYVHVSGTIRINAGGTLIPAISLTTGSVTPAVGINSYFCIWPVGSGTVTTIGNWN